jgi:SAM-dependent methyltransferase
MKDTVTNKTHLEVQQYYGETLSASDDLKTNACCTAADMPAFAKQHLKNIHSEVLEKYYGCGLVLPESLEGLSILDLGCGAGRDVYLLSALVGPAGRVVGVDMTAAQLDVARTHQDYHAQAFQHSRSNVEFVEANIEALGATNLKPESFDLIVSNCVINLAVDKRAVLADAYRLLRAGGEMYFSDIYADRRIPARLKEDPVLYGECLSGAMYPADFVQISQSVGFPAPRLVETASIEISDPDVTARVGDIRFCSSTYRLFKVSGCEATEENYGQMATYLGSITEHPEMLHLDQDNRFPVGQATPVSRNTAQMLSQSRFCAHFEIIGSASNHLGAFSGNLSNFSNKESVAARGSSSCC